MKFSTIINRYIFKELFSPFLVSLLFLSFIFLMTRIPKLTNMVVNHNAGINSLFLLLLYSFPRFLEFIFPMSVMISVLLTFMRMAGDNEIVALKGGGISLYRFLPPVLLFCTLITCIAFLVSIVGVPKSKAAIESKTIEIVQSSLGIAMQERVFNTDIDGIMMYVSSIDIDTKQLSDVFIEDSRTDGIINISTAPIGIIVYNDKLKIYTLRLLDGKINQVNIAKNYVNSTHFTTYDINIDYKHAFSGSNKKEKKDLDVMSLKELYTIINDPKNANTQHLNKALINFYGKFSLPLACICLGCFALPLGIQSVSLKRSSGFGLGLFAFIVYFLLLALGWSAGESGKYPPIIGMWLPDIVMGGAGIYLLYRNAKERPLRRPLFISKLVKMIKNFIFREKAE